MAEGIWARGMNRLGRSWGKYMFDRTAAGVLSRAGGQRGLSALPEFNLSSGRHGLLNCDKIPVSAHWTGPCSDHIDDGSLTDEDISILKHHIPGIGVLDIASIDTGTCPRGGTWERLIKIIALTADHYVIQADADIVVSGPIPEVVGCCRQNRSFLLGTRSGQSVAPAAVTAELAQRWLASGSRNSVGTLAEAALDGWPEARGDHYVHASSGFAGFARGAFRFSDLEAFSACMRERLGVPLE